MTAVVLSPLNVYSEIDALLKRQELVGGLKARRGNDSDVESIHQFLTVTAEANKDTTTLGNNSVPTICGLSGSLSLSSMQCSQPIPVYIMLEKQNENGQWQLCALAQWSFGYSTWKGRVMNLNTFQPAAYEETGMKILTNIARILSCSRIVFQTTQKQVVDLFVTKHNAEELVGWLTLKMNKDEMKAFLETRASWGHTDEPDRLTEERRDSSSPESSQMNLPDIVNNVISEMNCSIANKADDEKQTMTLRLAQKEDAASVFKLVNGLAVYEKAADEVSITSEIYQRDGCGADHSIFHCILVELQDEIVGMGFFYFGYSAINGGKYLYLEDLFIQEAYRGRGCGRSIMLSLADIALRSDSSRFVWQALDWNTPALRFYQAIGANVLKGLVTVRLNEE